MTTPLDHRRRLQRQGLPSASISDIVKDLREHKPQSAFEPVTFTRAVALEDIRIRNDGTGRTVDAYAAVFMTPTEIVDADGHYKEQNHPDAFNTSLAQRRSQIFCIYNHGRTLQGTPSDLFSVPVGVPVPDPHERDTPYADSQGLWTSTRYNPDPTSDRILEAIRSGSLKGMSYTGVFLRSSPELDGPYDFWDPAETGGQLTLVTRQEIALIEYGPTPIPAYETAQVVGVRTRDSVTLTEGVSRSVAAIHHTPVNYSSTWDADHTLDGMTFPADQGDMEGMFAMFDDSMAGVSNGDPNANTGAFPRTSGYLPHHDLGPDGHPGPANSSAVSQMLARLDTLPDTYDGNIKEGARNHLLAHQADEDSSQVGVNASSGQGQQEPSRLDTASSGRDDADERPRAAMPTCDGPTHADYVGQHTHTHLANGALDANDGMHDHVHVHAADHGHEHTHAPEVMITSSARDDDDDRERKNNKPYGDVEYADPKNGKYPVDAEHVEAAWSYINKPENAAKYPLNGVTLSEVKAKIKAAMKKHGHEVSEGGTSGNNGSSSSSGRQPADADATSREAGEVTGPSEGRSAEPQLHPASSSSTEGTEMPETDVRMTVGERTERQGAIRARLAEIDNEYMGAELPAETRTEWRQLQEELILHQKAIKDATERARYLSMIAESADPSSTESLDRDRTGYDAGFDRSAGFGSDVTFADRQGHSGPAFRQDLGNAIYDLTAIRNRARSFDEVPALYREFAMRAVDRARYPTPDKSREDCQGTIERMLLNIDDNQGALARRILVTGSPVYDRAFGKALAAASINGLTAEEGRALQLGSDPAGGYAVPFQLDPTVILTSNGAINPLRQIARIEQIVGKEWDGVTSAGVTVARVAEGTEAASADAAFVQPTVRTTRVQGFVPFNIELDVSWGALRSQMTSLLMDAKDVEEATAFVTGNGTAPNANGVVQGTHDGTFTVTTATTATLAIGDLYSLENNMAPRFRQQSSYLASKTTFNRFRQLFQAQASAAFDSWVRPSAGTPATFNGYPAYEASAMATTITSGSLLLLQGDFSKFLIVDRVGMGIELIPHLFGATSRYPLGQRGILAIWFNNSKILAGNAFRLLQAL